MPATKLIDTYSLWYTFATQEFPRPSATVQRCHDPPEPHLFPQKIEREIRRLSKEYGSPMFKPHVTLLGGIPTSEEKACHVARSLVESRKIYSTDMRFTSVGYGSTFHQSVFVLADRLEPLLEHHCLVKEAFDMDDVASYMPHASLIYSTMSDAERRKLAEKEQSILFKNGEEEEWVKEVCCLELWYTPAEDLSLESWRLVESYPLSHPDTPSHSCSTVNK
jgi:hypothetical protein